MCRPGLLSGALQVLKSEIAADDHEPLDTAYLRSISFLDSFAGSFFVVTVAVWALPPLCAATPKEKTKDARRHTSPGFSTGSIRLRRLTLQIGRTLSSSCDS